MTEETVRDVMTAAPRTVPSDHTVAEAARLMEADDVGDVIVLNGSRVRGLVTDRDIVVRAIAKGLNPASTAVGDICSHDLVTIESAVPVAQAAEIMRDYAVRRLPVVDSGTLVGVVSLGDLAERRDPNSALGEISAAPPNR
jgi:CBS domain-containing protein